MSDQHPEQGPISFVESLGVRATRRAEPRASVAVAGAGCALGVLGVLVISADTGLSDGDFNKGPGIALSALVVLAGYVLLQTSRRGALASAGTVAAALGVPPLLFFITWEEGSFPPYSTDAILLVSTAVWLGSYAVGPARGRPFFLGAGLIALWATVLQLSEDLFDAPWNVIGWFGTLGPMDDGGFGQGPRSFDAPDPTTLGGISLVLGGLYLVIGRWLDSRGRHGIATPFAVATIPTLVVGALLLADELETEGTGLLLLAIGLVLAWSGAGALRRATAWIGGLVAAIGTSVFLGDMSDDGTTVGMLFLAGGLALVALAHAYAVMSDEPDELVLTGVAVPDPHAGPAPEVAPIPDHEIFMPPPPPPAPPAAADADATASRPALPEADGPDGDAAERRVDGEGDDTNPPPS